MKYWRSNSFPIPWTSAATFIGVWLSQKQNNNRNDDDDDDDDNDVDDDDEDDEDDDDDDYNFNEVSVIITEGGAYINRGKLIKK